MKINPLAINIPEEAIADLQVRLDYARFTKPTTPVPWDAGADPQYLRGLVNYWRTKFDWRARERELNSFTQFTAEINGVVIHFVHVRGAHQPGLPRPLPLLLSHGWPSCFIEMLPLVSLLTEPEKHGADTADAFDVVIPSLPGFAFSGLPEDKPITRPYIADLWNTLMTDALGYERYGAYGGDIGAGVTNFLAAQHPENLAGIHLIHPPMANIDEIKQPITLAENAYFKMRALEDEVDGGYSAIQITRPDTIAASLIDTPVGLAAWIVDKYRAWSDCHGDITTRFSFDSLLTIITLYWVTGCIGSSFRTYYDYKHNPPLPRIKVPTGITLSVEDRTYPRELAERTYTDIRHWSNPGVGGHFFPLEEPELLAKEIRLFFRSLRESK
jgi:pimeloyl-ACP methyl ester carboxylesterase